MDSIQSYQQATWHSKKEGFTKSTFFSFNFLHYITKHNPNSTLQLYPLPLNNNSPLLFFQTQIMIMFSSISNLPQEMITNLHYSRRLLLHSPFQHSQPTTPPPSYQVPDPSRSGSGSSHGNNNGFDANIVMILAVLVCALICSLCINTFIRCVIKCLSLILGEPNYHLNRINYEKKKSCGLNKRALKTFPLVKYSKDVNIFQGLSIECVICLCEFKSGEKLRVLPICNHGFHAKCIDKWFRNHSSCPTCRQSFGDTCKKIIGSDDNDQHQATSSSSSSSSTSTSSSLVLPSSISSMEVVTVNIMPLEREDMVRNYRSEGVES